jgi:hypothetical protein
MTVKLTVNQVFLKNKTEPTVPNAGLLEWEGTSDTFNIGADIEGIDRFSVSTGVLRPRKCRKWEYRPSLSREGLCATDEIVVVGEGAVSKDATDMRLTFPCECLKDS